MPALPVEGILEDVESPRDTETEADTVIQKGEFVLPGQQPEATNDKDRQHLQARVNNQLDSNELNGTETAHESVFSVRGFKPEERVPNGSAQATLPELGEDDDGLSLSAKARANGWMGADLEPGVEGSARKEPPSETPSEKVFGRRGSVINRLVQGPQVLFQKGAGTLKKAGGFPQKSILMTEQKRAARERSDGKPRRRLKHVHFKLPRKKGTGKGLHPIDPNSVFAERWLIFMVLPLSFELWAFPFRLAFGYPGDFGVLLGDCICDTFIVIDIIFMFCLTIPAYTYPNQEHDITSFSSIASFRLRRDLPMRFFPPFVFYVITAVLWGMVPRGQVSPELWIWWVASIPRVVTRLYRLVTYFRDIETNLEVSVRALQLFKFALIIFLSAHWVGCIFLFLSRLQDFSDVTWIREFEGVLPLFQMEDSRRDNRYLLCLYKGFNAMSNLNYGLGLPKSKVEMIWAMMTMAVQVYMNALILGTLLNFLVQKDPVQEAHKKRMEDLTAFMEAKNLPGELRDRIQKHFNFQHMKNVQNRAAASVNLPRSLQIKVADAKYKYIIDKCTDKGRTLHGCNMQFINAFLTRLKVMHVMAGEELTKKDEIPRELYFVLDGAVHVVDDENRVKRSIRNDVPDMSPIVGEVPFFLGINHPHTIRARPDGSVQLLVLTKEEAGEVFATYPEEYEQINANLLARFDLTLKGEDLGTGGDREMDADTAALKKSIIASMKQRSDRRFAQLLQSAHNGDVEAVMMEARQGADINQRNYDGRTILHMAAEDGNYKMVEMLIEQRADLNAKDRWGQTPLAEAVMNRQGLVAGLLTSFKAELAIENPAAVLCQFAYEANLEQVRRMIENGIDPNLRDNDGRTALHVGAAEGRHKIVEYLLSQGAEVNGLDRFASTPLQNAVQNSRILAVNILRSNGATMPEAVGPGEMCKAAAAGDVKRLRLLHDCDECPDCADYDSRTPLHMAAAEARLLAVSFLLGVSANPNAKDRWGGRPLDDALAGWTLYHKYCAKLIHGWGGKLGKLADTEEGREKMKELEDIDVDDIRNIVKRLIAHGHKSSFTRLSEQEALTQLDATIDVIPIVQDLRSRMQEASAAVQQTSSHLKDQVGGLCSSVAELMAVLSTPVPRQSKSHRKIGNGAFSGTIQRNVLGWRTDGSDTPLAVPGAAGQTRLVKEQSVSGQQSVMVSEINERLEALDQGEEELEEAEMEGDGAAEGGIDSEEEEMLHAEIDALLHVQEMAQQSNTSPEAMAARQFQEIALKVVQFEDAFESLASVCISVRIEELRGRFGTKVPLRATAGWMGKVTLEGLPRLLSLLRVDSALLDMETVYDQACAFSRLNPDLNRSKGGPGWDKIRRTVNTLSMLKSGLMLGLGGDEGMLRAPKVSLESLLAGSSLFRKAVLAMRIDGKLCAVMETWVGHILGEHSTRQLLVGCEEKTVRQGMLVFDAALESDLAIIVAGDASVEQSRAINRLSGAEAKPRNQVLVRGDFIGAYGALGLAYSPGLSAIATRQCTLIVVKTAHARTVFAGLPALRQALITRAGEAPVVLPEEEKQAPLERQPSRGGMLTKLGASAKNVMARKATRRTSITGMLRNAQRRLSRAPSSPSNQPADKKQEPTAEARVLTEIERRWIHDMVDSALSMWGLLSMGQPTVTRGHLLAVGTHLGEVSSECFRKMFLADRSNLPEQIDQTFFWRCWVAFLSAQVFGEEQQAARGEGEQDAGEEGGEAAAARTESERKAETQKQKQKQEEEEEGEERETVLQRLQYRFDKNRWLRRRFFEEEVIEMYEQAYHSVVGNLRDPMTEDMVAEFLMHVFVDFPFKISNYNVQEFLNVFLPNRNPALRASVTWGDVRKVLRERRLGLTTDAVDRSVFVGTVLNPYATWMRSWFVLIKLCGVYYFIVVPLRASFLPWDSMLHPSALGSDLTVDVICFLHVLVMFNTGYQNSRAAWVTRRIKILNKVNWASAFAAIPIDWFAYLCGASNEACCWLRVNKMLLLINWSDRGWAGFARLRTGRSKAWYTMLYMVAMTLHVAACLWFFLGARYKHWNPSHPISWLKVDDALASLSFSREEHFGLQDDASTGDQYMVSLYWVSATLTVNGLVGDVIPQNYAEVMFAIVLMALNMTLIRWIVGEVSTLVMGADKKVIEARKELEAVDQFVTGNNLPEKLQRQIKTHFRASNAQGHSSAVDQEALLNGMSHSLKVEVASFISREYLDGVELFAGCSERLLDAVSVLLLEVSFAPEEFLFRTSGPAKEMYFVVSGAIDELVGEGEEEAVEAVKRARSSVGGVAFFFGLRHLHSARASKLTGTTCLRVLREPFFELLKIYPADEEIIGNNAMASLEVEETRGRANSSRRSGSRRGSSVVSKELPTGDEDESRKSEAEAEEEEAGAGKEEEHEIATNSGAGDTDGEDMSDALEALVGSSMKDKINALKNRRKKQRVGLLMHAAAEGDIDKCSRLVRGDLPVNSADSNKRTALHVAASEGHLKLVKLLVELRADVHLKDKFANTPFNDAVRQQRDRVVHFLRETYPEIRMTLPGFKGAVLMCEAASKGDLPQIQRLVENGVSVNDGNYDSRTALHVAASEGHVEMCKYLLEAKAAPRCRDRFQGTPLVDAVREQQEAVQQLMRNNGGNLGRGHGTRFAAGLCQHAYEGDLDKVKSLLLNGVDPMEGDSEHRTCLHLSACGGQISVLEYLLRAAGTVRIDVNRVDKLGNTPLDDALRHDNEAAACILRRAGGVQRGSGAEYERLVAEQQAERASTAKALRQGKVGEVVRHCPEKRVKEAVEEQLLPGLARASTAVGEALAELCRRLAGLTVLIGRSSGSDGSPMATVVVTHGSSMGAPQTETETEAEAAEPDSDQTETTTLSLREAGPAEGPGGANVSGAEPEAEVPVVAGAGAGARARAVEAPADFSSMQEGAESVMQQMKKVRQAAGELRRVLEFGTAGTMEGIDCHLWKKLQHRYFMEAKAPVRQLRKANEIGKLVVRLMKEMVKAAKKSARRSSVSGGLTPMPGFADRR